MSFTCPRCSRTSHSPDDERQGYCGACHAFTGSLALSMWQFVASSPGPFGHVEVNPAAVARYIEQRYGDPGDMVALSPLEGLTVEVSGFVADSNALSRLITGWSQSEPLIQTDSGERQREVDDYPWDDAFTWSNGCAELD